MDEQSAASERFEKRWSAAIKAKNVSPAVDGVAKASLAPQALGELVIVIAEKAYAEQLIEKDERDKLLDCGQGIADVMLELPPDSLSQLLATLAGD